MSQSGQDANLVNLFLSRIINLLALYNDPGKRVASSLTGWSIKINAVGKTKYLIMFHIQAVKLSEI